MITFYLEYPPLNADNISVIDEKEYWQELPANYYYEPVTVGDTGDYPTIDALYDAVDDMNSDRHCSQDNPCVYCTGEKKRPSNQ